MDKAREGPGAKAADARGNLMTRTTFRLRQEAALPFRPSLAGLAGRWQWQKRAVFAAINSSRAPPSNLSSWQRKLWVNIIRQVLGCCYSQVLVAF